jgi:DNA repair photolyase
MVLVAVHEPLARHMVAMIGKAWRKSAVLTPSDLPCLRTIPTINLTAGCLHGCLYCYARGYSQFPGDGRVVLYENTLEMLREELSRRRTKPEAVYFSPSSDLFQPAPEVLDMAEAIIRFLLGEGVGIAFLSKGYIPDRLLAFLSDQPDLVRAQIGLITTDEGIARTFEPGAASPTRRLKQIEALVKAGVRTEARVDPILPTVTDGPRASERLFEALSNVGVTRAAIDLLFLRPAIVRSLSRHLDERDGLAHLFRTFSEPGSRRLAGTGTHTRKLPLEVRRRTFALMRDLAAAHGIVTSICACENPDLAHDTCNITGQWSRRWPLTAQLPFLSLQANVGPARANSPQ